MNKQTTTTAPCLLTKENASRVLVIECIAHPEWGTKRFTFDPSSFGHHSYGTGSNSAILFESEFKFWRVVKFKTYSAEETFTKIFQIVSSFHADTGRFCSLGDLLREIPPQVELTNAEEAFRKACDTIEKTGGADLESQAMEEAGSILPNFIGVEQLAAIQEGTKGEECQYFAYKMLELAHLFESMPKTGDQAGKGDDAIVYLHYFRGGMDWYITERDIEEEQLQAFGMADLGCGFPEVGYISILEIIGGGVELDFFWKPKTLAKVKSIR